MNWVHELFQICEKEKKVQVPFSDPMQCHGWFWVYLFVTGFYFVYKHNSFTGYQNRNLLGPLNWQLFFF